MPERTGAQNTVIAVSLIAVGIGGAWLSLAIGAAVWLGKAIHRADLEEGTAGTVDTPAPLLGVVLPPPRDPMLVL